MIPPPVPVLQNPSQQTEFRHYTSSTYLLPADEQERQRLDVQSKLISRLFGKPVIPSIHFGPETHILDLATGSGAWAFDVLEAHPTANQAIFHCVDIETRLFPATPPANMQFEKMSVLALSAEWSNKFHIVHQRLLLAALKYDEWPIAIDEIYRVTAPGSWAQLCELNPAETVGGPSSKKAVQFVKELAARANLDLFGCTARIPFLLKQAGFVDIKVEKRGIKLGKWGGQDGVIAAKGQIGAWRGMKTPVLRAGGFGIVKNEAEFDALMDETEAEWEETLTEEPYFTFTARKPEYVDSILRDDYDHLV